MFEICFLQVIKTEGLSHNTGKGKIMYIKKIQIWERNPY